MTVAETVAVKKGVVPNITQLIWGAAWALLAIVFLAFACFAIHFQAHPIADDAAIDFRYVDQVLAGRGIVYNAEGPHVYGASSLPYMLLLAVLHKAGIGLVAATLVLNIGGLAVSTALLFLLCAKPTEHEDPPLSPLLAVLPCASALGAATVVDWSTQGLECGFHLMLGMAAVWAFARRRSRLCGVFLGLALADKLDATSLAVALVAISLLRDRRQILPMLIGVACVFGPWVAFTWLYFGSPLPMSLQAKEMHEFAKAGHTFVLQYVNQNAQYQRVTLLALGGLLLARQRWAQALGLWFVAYVLLYDHVTRANPFPWYFFVSDYLLFALAGLGVARLIGDARLRGWLAAPFRFVGLGRIALPAATLMTTSVAVWILYTHIGPQINDVNGELQNQQRYSATVEADRVAIGEFVHRYSAPAESFNAGHGWPAYLSGPDITVYDGSGLNDPALVAAEKRGRAGDYWRNVNYTYLEEGTDGGKPPQDRYVLLATWDRSLQCNVPAWELWGLKNSHAFQSLRGNRLPLTFH